jgi:chromosome segregation ATPase
VCTKNEFDERIVQERISAAYRELFGQIQTETHRDESSRTLSPRRRPHRGSASARVRETSEALFETTEQRTNLDAQQSRIEELEERNRMLSSEKKGFEEDMLNLRKQLSGLEASNRKLLEKIDSLQSVVSTESKAEKVLERVSKAETSQVEFKLEIYRQQILMLNRELAELKSVNR